MKSVKKYADKWGVSMNTMDKWISRGDLTVEWESGRRYIRGLPTRPKPRTRGPSKSTKASRRKRFGDVIQETKDGVFVSSFKTIREAAEKLGTTEANICIVCNDKTGKTAAGFKWSRKYLF